SSDIYTALNDSDLDIDVNKDTGEVTMDSSVLFDVDSYKISEAGKKSLKEFMEEYTSIVFDSKHKDSVNAIVVEGHTDPDGSHEYNQELSQKRANAVMEYCIKLHPEIKDSIAAIGYSYDYPVLKADGSVDKAASRRVVFRVSGK
ncbi:MAG: OmpA family protein, partial [Ruminococcus sp.]|nr:OmpA family protein [Ruminococcus sp.]